MMVRSIVFCALLLVAGSAAADISGTFSGDGNSSPFTVQDGSAVVYVGSATSADFDGGVLTAYCYPNDITTPMVADTWEEPKARTLYIPYRTKCQLTLEGSSSPDLTYYVQTRP